MIILGLNAYHGDSSACILRDGELVMAIEEERLRRIKHWAGLPTEAVKACLADAGISISDVDHITISRDPSANKGRKIRHSLGKMVNPAWLLNRLANSRKIAGVKEALAQELGVSTRDIRAELHNIEHHRAHLASAFFASPFQKSALLSIDGMGDFTSTMTGVGEGNQISVLDSVYYPHSLGIFYTAFTQYLGFQNYGDEYKVMGLAPYGKPVYMSQMRSMIKTTPDGLFVLKEKYFNHFRHGVAMNWDGGVPVVGQLWTDEVKINLMPPRQKKEEVVQWHMDLAASVQKRCEEVIFHVLNHLHEKTGLDTLCIAGGVAQNSVANGKIMQNTPFKHIYIPPAGHDAGTSIGSALYLYNQIQKNPRLPQMKVAGLGSRFTPAQIEAALKANNLTWEKPQGEAYYNKVVSCLVNGGVVGWFQGRAEFGPRALGHRSILADPRRKDARDLLNKKIKKRESFRPFAPSILKEYVAEYFEITDDVPFMEKVFKIRPEKHKQIPAVTHVDGTGRLQTVDKDVNPRYYTLIEAFRQKTTVPILLNTSFNENEPIVNSPQEALDCYLRTEMDMIVLDDYIVERKA